LNSKENILRFFQKLVAEYGDPVNYWPQWCAKEKSIEDREKIIIGMVLVQRTTWHNANLALKNLSQNSLLSIKKIAQLKFLNKLTQLIHSAGFYQSKPKRLFDLCSFIISEGGVSKLMKNDTSDIKLKLLRLKGVGPETADTILLYALDKPVFIIDEYTRRFVRKNNLTTETDYLKLQQYFEINLPKNIDLYQKLHALVIICQRGVSKSTMEIV